MGNTGLHYWSRLCAIAALTFTLFNCSQRSTGVEIVEGRLNLRESEIKNNSFYLNGNWAYRDLSVPGKEHKRGHIKLPGNWNEKMGSHAGYAEYSAAIELPPNTPNLALRMPVIYSSWRLFVNGREIDSNGNPDVSGQYQPRVGIRYVPLPQNIHDKELNLTIEVANYTYPQGGIQRQIEFGDAKTIHQKHAHSLWLRIFISTVLFMAFINHIFHYIFHPTHRSHLFFAMICMILAIRNLTLGEVLLYDLGITSYEIVARITYAVLFPLIPAATGFIASLFPGSIDRRFIHFTLFLGGILSLSTFLPLSAFLSLKLYAELILVGTLIVLLVYLLLFAVQRKPLARLVLASFAITVLGAVNDTLHANEIITTSLISNYTMLLLIISLSLMLSYEFSSAYRRVDKMAAELSLANSSLLDFKTELEQTVKERTAELEKERNELDRKNRTIDSELELARKIQHKLIPNMSPFEEIAWYYSSLDKVCGDFFDFIELDHPDRVGIFLSDVSGHGVPAAFITSLLKGILIETAPAIEDPALLLARLYDSLFNQMSGNFVTAFYGIYDRSTKELQYATAGHPPPFIISAYGVSKLQLENPGPIIGIFSGQKLWAQGRQPVSSRLKLKPGEKVIIYTDGLTETTKAVSASGDSSDPMMFEYNGLMDALKEAGTLSAVQVIETLGNALNQFRGSEKFEDDVCIVCLEAT